MELTEANITAVLKGVFDPEIPINIIDLGLVYDISILPDGVVEITMTLTTPGCPLINEFVDNVKSTIMEAFENVPDVKVEITFDPPWNPSRISEEALFTLGIQAK